MEKIAVLGIGNILLRDDGIGVHIINELQNQNLNSNVELIDGGTCILDLLGVFVENNKVIVVDSLKEGICQGLFIKSLPKN